MAHRENVRPRTHKRVFWKGNDESCDVFAERVCKFLDALSDAGIPFGNIIVSTASHVHYRAVECTTITTVYYRHHEEIRWKE